MAVVEAGNVSGIYYLLFSGLHKDADWRDIKDYARSHNLDIDYVEIFPNLLGGWIRVIGLERYRAACAIFAAALFHGKSLILEARNEDQRLPLLFPPPSNPVTSKSLVHPSVVTDQYTPMFSNYEYSSTAHEYSQPFYGYTAQQYSMPPDFVPYHIPPDPVSTFGTQAPYGAGHSRNCSNSHDDSTIPRQSGMMYELRKVLIKKLPAETTGEGLEQLVAWIFKEGDSPFKRSWIERIEIPRDKAHAFIWMEKYEQAVILRDGINELDVWGGSKLEAKLATEGAPPNRDRKHTSSGKTSGKHTNYSQKENGKSNVKSSRSITPAIANGSGSGSSKSKHHRH